MAMTPAERKKAQREREKDQEQEDRLKLEDSTYPFLKVRFGEWFEDYPNKSDDFDLPLELAGFEPPDLSDERDPKEFVIDELKDALSGSKGAIGRAEVMAGCLLDVANGLARAINRYKREEIEARIAELETSETTDRATAINEIIRLRKILDLLDKRVRRDLPQWRITGV